MMSYKGIVVGINRDDDCVVILETTEVVKFKCKILSRTPNLGDRVKVEVGLRYSYGDDILFAHYDKSFEMAA